MKLLLVNSLNSGGAANACKRLHLSLLEQNIDSKLLSRNKNEDVVNSFSFEPRSYNPSLSRKFREKSYRLFKKLNFYSLSRQKFEKGFSFLEQRPEELEMFSLPYSSYDITESPIYQEADLINLHWVANFLDYKSFFRKNNKPVIWTLHDMNPFKGIDHYSEKYLGMDSFGRPKLRVITEEEKNFNIKIENIKMESIKKIRHLTIVSPSKWLADEASKSQIFADRPIKVIPNSLDENLFFPKDQKISRKLLRLPLNKKIILFVADSVTNYRKGFEFLQKALENFDPSIFVLCSIGSANDLNIMNNIQLGQISEEHVMSTAYSAADVFVIPSLIDNLPNTVMESLMCGTPVIGFPTGGIPEMIQNMENGLITEEISADSLKHTVEFFFEKQEIFDREQIRVSAVKKYSKNVQGKAYISLFNDIMNNAI